MRYLLESPDGTRIGVADGRICDPADRFDLTVPVPAGELRPGLINPHDHLHRNHYPRLGSPPYPDAYVWGKDIHERWGHVIERGRAFPRSDALLFGALKNLLGAVTSVVHHDPWHPMFDVGFPLRVVRVRVAHSLALDPGLGDAETGDPTLPFCIHLAEGTTPEMAEEVLTLRERGWLNSDLIAVHGVGVDSAGVATLRSAGAAVVWCPTSNEFLLGRTAPAELLRSGIDVLLGSDSLVSAEGTLLDELRAARRLGLVEDAVLLDAVGALAARRLGLPAPELTPGRLADIVCLRRSPLEASPADVHLVVVGGQPRLGTPDYRNLFEAAGVPTNTLMLGGVEMLVASPLGAIAQRTIREWPEAGRIFS